MDNQSSKPKKATTENICSLLSFSLDYSYVKTLSDFLKDLSSANKILKMNIEELSFLNKKKQSEFEKFLNSSIICFPKQNKITNEAFFEQVTKIDIIEINPNFTILNILAQSIYPNNSLDNRTFVQFSGLKANAIYENNSILLKQFSNRIINTKNFELLRLNVGDWILSNIFEYCTVIVYDFKAENYIQILGASLKEYFCKSLNVPKTEKIMNNNYNFQKVFTYSNIANSTLGLNFNFRSAQHKIPTNLQYMVERTRIYYCPNFNRKLGFFKKLCIRSFEKNELNNKYSNDSFAMTSFNKIFIKSSSQIPLYIKEKLLDYLNEIAKGIQNFEYVKLIYKFCPIMKNWKNTKKLILDKIKVIEDISTDQNKQTQVKEEVDKLNEYLITLINESIPIKKVYNFASCFIKKIIPKDFLGKDNMKVLLEKLKLFIQMNRFETFNRENLFGKKEFTFKGLKWLNLKMSNKVYTEIGISLKNYILKNTIHWIFDFIIVQFFRSHFFITEKQGDHFKTFYYHKIIYDFIIKICFCKYIYISKQYMPFEHADALKLLISIDSAPGRLRLMPKPSTMRPITSFKKKTLGKSKSNLKNALFTTQKIFKFIQNKMQKKKQNCVVFDYKEIIKRLSDFKLKFVKTNSNYFNNSTNNKLTKFLSYITMDIEACYDNIDINLLIKFLNQDDTISSSYMSALVYVLIPKINKLKINEENKKNFNEIFDIKIIHVVEDLKDYIHMLDFFEKNDDITYKNCLIFADNITYQTKELFIPKIKDVISNNCIKFNRHFLKQIKGIPQGLSVSSFLCNLFFYELEKEITLEIQKNDPTKNSILLRFMDDYLCLTTNEKDASYFFENSIKLSKSKKFNFNLKKSQTNCLEIEERKNNDLDNKFFVWNGISFQLNEKHYFNLIYEGKVSINENLGEYKKLINVNLPLFKNSKDPTWLVKKINSVLFAGHPWIYFLQSINENEVLVKNLENFIQIFLLKLIVLIEKFYQSNLKISQKKLIDVIDTSIMKTFSFFESKIYDIEHKGFFVNFNQFHIYFYSILFKNYFIHNEKSKETKFNQKLISFCPFLFKAIKRKIERLKIVKNQNILMENNNYFTNFSNKL